MESCCLCRPRSKGAFFGDGQSYYAIEETQRLSGTCTKVAAFSLWTQPVCESQFFVRAPGDIALLLGQLEERIEPHTAVLLEAVLLLLLQALALLDVGALQKLLRATKEPNPCGR